VSEGTQERGSVHVERPCKKKNLTGKRGPPAPLRSEGVKTTTVIKKKEGALRTSQVISYGKNH